MDLVIATGNPHKIEEFRTLLAPARVRGLANVTDTSPPEPVEDGDTFEANAELKAAYYARAIGRACLADDSGLEVDALGGAPGVYSARYAADELEAGTQRDAIDVANYQKLLRALEGVEPAHRTARFVCAVALTDADGKILITVRGTFDGRIGLPGEVPRGAHGFGYDPVFLVAPEHQRTSAELAPEDKAVMSHRGAAARRMLAEMRTRGLLNGSASS